MPEQPTAAQLHRMQQVETAARVMHERRHPLGYADTCGSCTAAAIAAARILDQPPASDGTPAGAP